MNSYFFLTSPGKMCTIKGLLPAILSALVFPELVTGGNPRHLDFSQPQLWVALPTFLFALKTKSLGGTVVVGMLLFWLAGKLL
jgi:branched-subunit amino acid transport protein